MAKTTSTERSRKRWNKLNELAKKYGYSSWGRLSTAILRGDVIMTLSRPDIANNNEQK